MTKTTLFSISNLREEVLIRTWTKLSNYRYDYTLPDGTIQHHLREAYNRGDGVTALLYDPKKKTVLLIQQFRLPTYVNGNATGLLIETCAGKLEEKDPEAGIRREIEEETGHRVKEIKKIFEVFMSPGSVTEKLHFYIARYGDDTRVSAGGGLKEENENISLLELPLSEALDLINRGEIKDAKTIMLLQYAALHNIL